MNRFKPTLISSLVTATLAATTVISLSAAADIGQTLQPIVSKYAKAQLRANTITGMANQYDQQLGQTTFSWASKNQSTPDFTNVPEEQQLKFAADYYLNSLIGVSTAKDSKVRAVLSNMHNTGRGARIAKYQQQVDGVEVFNREVNILMNTEMKLVAASGYFADLKGSNAIPNLSLNLFGNATDAIKTAFSAMGGDKSDVTLSANREVGKYQYFSAAKIEGSKQLVGEPRAKKVYFEANGELIPAYYVELQSADTSTVESEYKSFVVNAKNSKVLFEHSLQAEAEDFSYRVHADADGKPWDGPHGNVIPAESAEQDDATEFLDAPLVTLANGPISTDDPWLADDATSTNGNNVTAYVDAIAPDGLTTGDYAAETTAPLTFDHMYSTDEVENSVNNRKAAIVNLFYMNNYLHDDYYDHGFDEASGNAQTSNYGRGGEEGDQLRVEVQDNSGTNNANMSTPADGFSPRMQMYLWDSKDAVNGEDYGLTVTSNASLGLQTSTQRSGFGVAQFTDVVGTLVAVDDGTDTVSDGCEAAVNGADLAGNIAVIDRGACSFTQKVLNAQNAGAVAAIIINNTGTTEPAPMGGSDAAVTIPNFGLSLDEGTAIYAEMALGDVTVSMFNNKPYKASSWDNAIVSHEWGHYISNRLVGNSSGLINNQGRSMGEGWGDFHALMMLAEADDLLIAGNEELQKPYAAISYVASFYDGIRLYPYTTDMTINPHVFEDIGLNPQVHASGTVWATMLWDSFVALVNDERHTFDEAQNLMKDYLVAGYKMTPIAPTYTEARDAILAAAYANDTADYDLILAAFARRGMGAKAVSPARFSTNHSGVVNDFETLGLILDVSELTIDTNYEGVSSGYCTNDNILDKGETGTISLTLNNKGTIELASVTAQVEVASSQTVTFANEGMITFDALPIFGSATSSPLEFTLDEAGTAEALEFTVTFPDLDPEVQAAASFSVGTSVNMDFETRAPVGNQTTDNMETASIFNDWNENIMFGGELAEGTLTTDSGGNIPFFESFGVDLGDTAMLLINNGFQSDVAYETNEMTIGYGNGFSIDFWHFYALEANWDGGVVEISVNGSEWVDVTEMGGSFAVGYNTDALIENSSQVLQDRPVFSGRNNDVTWGNNESITFGPELNGNSVKFRFRIGTDSNSNDIGWWIDNVTFSNITNGVFSDVIAGDSVACDNRLPVVTAEDISIQERDSAGGALNTADLVATAYDPNGETLSYAWTQLTGDMVTLTNADTATATFTAPAVSATTTLTFNVAVSDGIDTVNKTVSAEVVEVANNAPVVETPRRSSGGGSLGIFGLLLLALGFSRKKKQ